MFDYVVTAPVLLACALITPCYHANQAETSPSLGTDRYIMTPLEVVIKVVSKQRMEEIRGYLRRYPLIGRDGNILRHEPNIL